MVRENWHKEVMTSKGPEQGGTPYEKRRDFYLDRVKFKLKETFDDVIKDLPSKGFKTMKDLDRKPDGNAMSMTHEVKSGDTLFSVLKKFFLDNFASAQPSMTQGQAEKEAYLSLAFVMKNNVGANVDALRVGGSISIDSGYLTIKTPGGKKTIDHAALRPAVAPAAAELSAERPYSGFNAVTRKDSYGNDMYEGGEFQESNNERILIKGLRRYVDGSFENGEFDPVDGHLLKGTKKYKLATDARDDSPALAHGEFNESGFLIRGTLKLKDGTIQNGDFFPDTDGFLNGIAIEPDGKAFFYKDGHANEYAPTENNGYAYLNKDAVGRGMGYFFRNRFSGKGVYRNSAGVVLEGEFVGKGHGKGWLLPVENTFTEPHLKKGTAYYPDGKVEEGVFRDGELVSGTRILRDGIVLEGDFENGKIKNGTVYYHDGLKTEQGTFDDKEQLTNGIRASTQDGKEVWEEGEFKNNLFTYGTSIKMYEQNSDD